MPEVLFGKLGYFSYICILQTNNMSELKKLITNKSGNITFETTLDPLSEVFERKGQGLYGWQYRNAYELELTTGIKKPIKFGQYGTNAKEGSTPQETIDSYCGTTSDSIVIRYARRLSSDEINTIGNAYHIEQSVGPKLGQKISLGKSTEVFDTNIDIIEKEVQNFMYPADGFLIQTKKDYPPRFRQEEVIKKFTNYFRNGGTNALLGAVMRFGKNFVWLNIGKNLLSKGDTMIMLTSRPEVFSSLKDDSEGHIYFNDFSYSELKNVGDTFIPKKDKINVLAISTQLLSNTKNKDKYKQLLSNLDCTLLGLDEATNGILTDISEDMIDYINSKYRVYIDGTPWKLEATGLFNEENTYIHSYIDRMKDFKDGIDKRAVQMQWRMVKVMDSIIKDSVWYNDDEMFTLTKLFSFNDKTNSFIHEGHVNIFLQCILGAIPKTTYSPYKMVELNHTFWLLPPSVKAIKRLKALINKIEPSIKVFAATDGDVYINDIKDFIKWNPNVKTITLSLGSLTRGTTLPEWDGVFMLCDTTTPELYFQTGFRVSTEMEGKSIGYVFDFDPNRTLKLLYYYGYKAAELKGITNPTEIIKEILDNFNVFHLPDGVQFQPMSIDDMLNKIRNADLAAKALRMMRDYINLNGIESIKDDKLKAFLSNYGKTKKVSFIEEFGYNPSIKKGKNVKISKQAIKKDIDNTEKSNWVSRIQSLCSRLPLMTELGYKTIEEIILNMDDNLFFDATNTDKVILEKLIEYKIINPSKINLRLA
jgi:hypothetical protein